MPYPFDVYISSDFGNDSTGNGDEATPYASIQGFIDNHTTTADDTIGIDNSAPQVIPDAPINWNTTGGNKTTTNYWFEPWDRAANGSPTRFDVSGITGNTNEWLQSGSNKHWVGLEFWGNKLVEQRQLMKNIGTHSFSLCKFTNLGSPISTFHNVTIWDCFFDNCLGENGGGVIVFGGRANQLHRCLILNSDPTITISAQYILQCNSTDVAGATDCIFANTAENGWSANFVGTRPPQTFKNCLFYKKGTPAGTVQRNIVAGVSFWDDCHFENMNAIHGGGNIGPQLRNCTYYNVNDLTSPPDKYKINLTQLLESGIVDDTNFVPSDAIVQVARTIGSTWGVPTYPDLGAVQKQVTGGGGGGAGGQVLINY